MRIRPSGVKIEGPRKKSAFSRSARIRCEAVERMQAHPRFREKLSQVEHTSDFHRCFIRPAKPAASRRPIVCWKQHGTWGAVCLQTVAISMRLMD